MESFTRNLTFDPAFWTKTDADRPVKRLTLSALKPNQKQSTTKEEGAPQRDDSPQETISSIVTSVLSELRDEVDDQKSTNNLPTSTLESALGRISKEKSVAEIKKGEKKTVIFKEQPNTSTIIYEVIEPKIEYLTSRKLKE